MYLYLRFALFKIPFYSWFGLYRILFYSVFGLYRILFYSGFSLYRIAVCETKFCSIIDQSLFYIDLTTLYTKF
jgi:hypothetical protein